MINARGSKAPLVILIWNGSLYHVKRKKGPQNFGYYPVKEKLRELTRG
jgi:hypothetical protein